jgi:hypothetical protein
VGLNAIPHDSKFSGFLKSQSLYFKMFCPCSHTTKLCHAIPAQYRATTPIFIFARTHQHQYFMLSFIFNLLSLHNWPGQWHNHVPTENKKIWQLKKVIIHLRIRTQDSTFHEDHKVQEETYLSLCLCASSLKPLTNFNEIWRGKFILGVSREISLPTLHDFEIELYQHFLS